LRKKLIEDCIYGVDIQERAVHLARLRLWLSLIVDTEVADIGAIPPLINLDFKIVKGDSLVSKICGFVFDFETQLAGRAKKTSEQMALFGLRGKYNDLKLKYAEAVTVTEKEKLRNKIDKTRREIAIWHLKSIHKKKEKDLKGVGAQRTLVAKTRRELAQEDRQRAAIDQELSDIDEKIKEIKRGVEIDAFNWELNFFEVMGVKGGFDIVIANPPYGVAVDKAVSDAEFGLGNSDSYGVFAALGVNILKPGGTLCYIMSDTWQTIRTHYKLRKKLFEATEAQYIVSVPMRTFTATVNTGIYLFKKSTLDTEKDNLVIAADFHGLDIKNGDLENGFEELIKNEPDETYEDGYTIISDREKAIYAYRQKIIKKFSNLSFFIASPKLFALMDDTTTVTPGNPPAMKVDFNGKEIELVKLGDIAKVVVGLQTGDNDYYLRQLRGTKGSNYKEVDLNLVLKEDELGKIRGDEELRFDIIENGICTNSNSKVHQHRYFDGRYFVPYDKGGASNIEEGWLPNYYVPTPFFIDWSEEAVRCLLEGKFIRKQSKKPFPRNIRYYFKEGITFSVTGIYAPMYKISTRVPFDHKASCIFSNFDRYDLLGILNSKFFRYLLKSFMVHTVEASEGAQKNFPYNRECNFKNVVMSIIKNQKQNLHYDYMTNEQLEIDKLVYEMYNLNEEDIQEVENWYYRRYPKLAKAIEEKLKVKNND
jgi:tRNA1(Val) A37 N6-methylase TrmN6